MTASVTRMSPGILATVLSLAACNIGQLGDTQTYQSTSPGMVTFKLDLPSTRSFCDQVATCGTGVYHVSFSDVAGHGFTLSPGFCATLCSGQCTPQACPAIPCISAGGQAVTQIQESWDGAYYEPGKCGSGFSCFNRRYVLPGRYVAHMCATPGTLVQGDAGPPNCTAVGPPECVDVTFELPGPPTIERALPDVAPDASSGG